MGCLYVVATPIGNLNDISKRAIDTLKASDYILAEDTRQTIKLLNHFDIKVKMISYHKFNETKVSDKIIEDLENGKTISLVSDAGSPCISDPGFVLVKKAREKKIEVLGVPGACAVIDALMISGLDTSSFTFYGFVPTENKKKKELFSEIKNSKVATKVLYESPKRILKLLEDIKNEMPGCKVCVCTELTKVYEKTFFGNIEEIIDEIKKDDNAEKGEYVVIINNEVVNERKDDISLESMIVNEMVNNNCSVKEAVSILNKKLNNISKKIYIMLV